MRIGFAEKIGYSFVGLLAGNVASVVVLVVAPLLAKLDAFAILRNYWPGEFIGGLGLSLMIGVVSMLGWAVVGVPVVLLLRTRIVSEFYGITAALVGAMQGMAAIFLFFLALNGGKLDTALFSNPEAARATAFYVGGAALISGVAFTVYCALVKSALRRQVSDNGTAKAPRPLAWFGC